MTHSPHPGSARPGAGLARANPAASARALSALAGAATVILVAFAQFVFGRFHALGEPTGAALHRRIVRAYQRLQHLLALAAQGREPRRYAPRPSRRGTAPRPRPVLPRRRGWGADLLGHHGNAYGSQLHHLLTQPDTIALLRAAPARTRVAVARAVRPLLHMFAWPLPDMLQAAGPPRPRRRRPYRPKPRPDTPRPDPPRPAPLSAFPPYPQRAIRHWRKICIAPKR